MKRILIIGFGNPHRGDDGAGYRAAEELNCTYQEQARVEVLPALELKPEMAETLSQCDMVVFIDAAVNGEPGKVVVRELLPQERLNGFAAHDLGPRTLLAGAKVLYGRCPEAMLVTVAGENFGIGARLSPKVEAAMADVRSRVCDIVRNALEREAVHG